MKTIKNKPPVILTVPPEPLILSKESVHTVQLPRWAREELIALRAVMKNMGTERLPDGIRELVDEKQGERQDAFTLGLCAGAAFRFARESWMRGER